MPHQCPHCEYTTRRNNNMERHIQSIHIVKENKVKDTEFKCRICLKEFTTKGNCLRHESLCIEKSNKPSDIYSFTSKIKDINFDFQQVLLNLNMNHSTQDIVSESVRVYNSTEKYKNMFITSLRSKICYTLGDNGLWEITDKDYALNKRTKEFIETINKSLKLIKVNNETFNNFKKIWHNNFDKMITDTKFYRTIKKIMEASIYNYTKQQFPDGKFSHIPCSVIHHDIDKPLTLNIPHIFDKVFCFSGKIED